jgi:Late competence development protein ComFB
MDYQHQNSFIKNYMNVMELLVEEEVRSQTQNLSDRTAEVLRSGEIIAYALNQLPPLYATTQRGWEYQVKEGRQKYAIEITQAVRCAINAVMRDPIMTAVPLSIQVPSSLRKVLHDLRIILGENHLEWEDIPKSIEKLFHDRVLYHQHQLSKQVEPLALLERGEYRPNSGFSRPGYVFGNQHIRHGSTDRKTDGKTHFVSETGQGWNDPLAVN